MIYKMAQNEDFQIQTKSGGIVNVPPIDGNTELVTKKQVDEGWWSEWTCDPTEFSEIKINIISEGTGYYPAIGDTPIGSTIEGSENEKTLVWGTTYGWVGSGTLTATRHRVAAPIPLKTSDLKNDGEGTGSKFALLDEILVSSVNSKNGNVILTATDVSALALSGGSVSGDVEIYKSNFNIYIGNYIQSDSEYTANYSNKNVFIQGETAPTEGLLDNYGSVYAGTKGYCILSVNSITNELKLSGTISAITSLIESNSNNNLPDLYNGLSSDPYHAKAFFPKSSKSLRLAFNDNFNTSVTKLNQVKFAGALHTQGSEPYMRILGIVDAENGIISVDQIPNEIIARAASFSSEEDYINEFINDDNNFYAPGLPEIGNMTIEKLNGQHVEGGSNRAVGKFAHVEGRDNFADVRFSHTEGTCNFAGSIAAHVEGRYSTAYGEYSHAAGVLANSKDNGAWTWNGNINNISNPSISERYSSHGKGTFNIYPRATTGDDPFTGFYIGEETLADRTIKKSTLVTTLNAIDTSSIQDQNTKFIIDTLISTLKNL